MSDLQDFNSLFLVQFSTNEATDKSIIRSRARIKLGRLHLFECDALAVNHKRVLALIREEYILKISLSSTDPVACIELKNQRSSRLFNVMIRHHEERVRMKERHRQEKELLEQVSRTY